MRTKTVVINLDRRPDRYQQFLNSFPFEHERFSAFDGNKIVKEGNLSDFRSVLFSILQSDRRNPTKQLNGIFGCWLSHYTVWNNLLYDFNNDAYVIFEDDIITSERFNNEFSRIVENIDNSFDMFYFGGRFNKEFSPKNMMPWKKFTVNNLEVYSSSDKKILNHDHDRGLFSYILTKKGASKLVSYANDSIYNGNRLAAVDGWVNERRDVIDVCDVFPHITWSPANFNSDIR